MKSNFPNLDTVLGKIIIGQRTSNKCFIGFYVIVKTIGEQYNQAYFSDSRFLYSTFAAITMNLKKAVSTLSFLTLKCQNKIT